MFGTLKILQAQIKLTKAWSQLVFTILLDERIPKNVRQEWARKAQQIADKEPF
jgi:uncharacterized protein (UPF0147 family)